MSEIPTVAAAMSKGVVRAVADHADVPVLCEQTADAVGGGGNKAVQALQEKGRIRRLSEHTGRNSNE